MLLLMARINWNTAGSSYYAKSPRPHLAARARAVGLPNIAKALEEGVDGLLADRLEQKIVKRETKRGRPPT